MVVPGSYVRIRRRSRSANNGAPGILVSRDSFGNAYVKLAGVHGALWFNAMDVEPIDERTYLLIAMAMALNIDEAQQLDTLTLELAL